MLVVLCLMVVAVWSVVVVVVVVVAHLVARFVELEFVAAVDASCELI